MNDKDEILAFLGEQEFFKGMDPGILEFLADCAERREVGSQVVLFKYDDAAEEFFIVREGEVLLEVAAIEGPALDVQKLGPGKVIGWSWLIRPYRWDFQGRAVTDSVVYAFDGGKIRERCEADHDFGYAILQRFAELMSVRLVVARQRMIDEWRVAGFA